MACAYTELYKSWDIIVHRDYSNIFLYSQLVIIEALEKDICLFYRSVVFGDISSHDLYLVGHMYPYF